MIIYFGDLNWKTKRKVLGLRRRNPDCTVWIDPDYMVPQALASTNDGTIPRSNGYKKVVGIPGTK